MRLRIATALVGGLLLAGCAGQIAPAGGRQTVAPRTEAVDMSGRWKLATPNAPSCGMHFEGARGGNEGSIKPEGGCPERFFTSRHWTFNGGQLTIINHLEEPLAQLRFSRGSFAGKSTTGTPVTLSRNPSPAS